MACFKLQAVAKIALSVNGLAEILSDVISTVATIMSLDLGILRGAAGCSRGQLQRAFEDV